MGLELAVLPHKQMVSQQFTFRKISVRFSGKLHSQEGKTRPLQVQMKSSSIVEALRRKKASKKKLPAGMMAINCGHGDIKAYA